MQKSRGSSSSKTPQTKARSRSRSVVTLTLEDVHCSICLNIFIHPVTLPCTHSLCHSCFCRSIRITALSCPFCRRRLSIWSRKAIKEKTLINHTFMRQIKKQFPAAVAARLEELKREKEQEEEEEDDDDEDEDGLNSLLIRTVERTPTSGSDSSMLHEPTLRFVAENGDENFVQRPQLDGVLSKPGEIAKEYMTLLQKYQSECEREKQTQISASEALIEKMTQQDKELENMKPSPSVSTKKSLCKVKKATKTVKGHGKKPKINPMVIITKENMVNSSRNSHSSGTSTSDSGIFSSASSFSSSSTFLTHNEPGPSRQSSRVQVLNIYNTPSSSASPSTSPILLDDVDIEAEKEALERFKWMREQEEKDRKLALQLQRELRKMELEAPTKRITRSNIRKPSTRSRRSNN